MAETQEFELQTGAETSAQPKRRGRPPKAAKPQGVAPEIEAGEEAVDYRHKAKRKNNPLAGLAAQNRVAEPPKITYAYNPHLPPVLRFDATGEADKIQELLALAQQRPLNPEEAKTLQEAFSHHQPWLEWSGKREKKGFQVDPVALHIHERVSTQAILRAVQRQDIQRSLFADPEMDAKAAVEFYQHDVDWANRLILGDSLQVMTSLARRENLAGQVQMIYMDPPYGIKFGSNFQPEIGKRDVQDRDQDLTREPEMVKAYRDTWALGVHSYLSYIRDRLYVCKELLSDEGSIFVQISDENYHRIRSVMDEVFGPENFLISIVVKTKGSQKGGKFDPINMYIIWYVKNYEMAKINKLFVPRILNDINDDPEDSLMLGDLTNGGFRKTTSVPFEFQNKVWKPGSGRCWSVNLEGMNRIAHCDRIQPTKNQIRFKKYIDDFPLIPLTNLWTDTGGASDKVYAVQTPLKVIQRCMLMATSPGDLVLDPTCGSGTTAMVAEQWGRRWITCDSSRVALAIARKRILSAKFDYYQLQNPEIGPLSGFKYKTVPHITIKSIAQNSYLDQIFKKHKNAIETALEALNKALENVSNHEKSELLKKISHKEKAEGKKAITEADRRRWVLPGRKWEHWEVPFDTDPDWPEPLKKALEDYRTAWRAKMDEVNACIAANAEQEELVDQPVVVKGITRVSGPFTVEAVMPPVESMAVEPESPIGGAPEDPLDTFGEGTAIEPQNAAAFQDQVLGLLRTGGVDFLGNKHVDFTRLDAIPGSVLHAEGEWTLPDGTPRKVAVSIGPRVGNVGDLQVEQALRQANRKGFDDLLFAGFGFDAVAQAVIQEHAEDLEGVQTHLFLIRPDVVMGDLLKNTAASQLFTAMGLPRTKLEKLPGEEFRVGMEGVDIYDPVINALIPTGADKVAAWFVDSDYDGRCFCITQAFFPDKSAWDKLAKALKSTVDQDRMEAFSGTVSLPFKAGKHQRVAIKVIDPRGNEVMAVHRLV
jgi:adenine-specific DNA-methyltransferase